IDRISVFVNALDDAVRALVEFRTEESRYGRIALKGGRKRQRCKAVFAVRNETRVNVIKLDKLLALAHTNTRAALPKPSEQVQVANIDKTICTEISRKTAAVCQNSRRLFFHVDEHI